MRQCFLAYHGRSLGRSSRRGRYIRLPGGQAPQHVVNVIIDRSVREIEEHAFGQCPNLQYVEFHRGVLRVKRWAFSASKLTQIHMPGVEVIETYAFVGCQALRNVTMPSVRVLGEKAFHGCKSIEVLDLPSVACVRSGQ